LAKVADPGERSSGESFEVVEGYIWQPAWSPNSDRLAVVSGYGPARKILLVSGLTVHDPKVTTLVDMGGDVTGPAWSPDGTLIAFFVTNADESNGVFVVRPDGDEPTRLADIVPSAESSPSWAPNGAGLVFAALDGVWSVNVDGSGLARVTAVPRGARSVVLSPDGSKVAFVADGYPYVVGLDGSGLVRLAEMGTGAGNLVWSPDGKHLMFSSQ
jgi:Tol biopolymer transport system component